jgi:hypothetical protein
MHPILKLLVGIALIVGALTFQKPAHSADWLVITMSSYHAEPDRGYNEKNWGLGLEHDLTDNWRVSAGTYRNSLRRQTIYVGAVYHPLRIGPVHVGMAVMAGTGYAPGNRLRAVVFPTLSYEAATWGLNLYPLTADVVGVQFKLKF